MTPPPSIRSERENVIPLINVVFLLLIFFMIAGQMTQPEALPVTPAALTSEHEAATLENKLLINEASTIMHGDATLQLGDIQTSFKDVKNTPLMVKIDKDCTRDCFLPVLGALQHAGVTEIRLVTLHAPNP